MNQTANGATAPAYTKEQMAEWGYPKYDERYDDPNWLREQFRKEREDPRENENFFVSPSDPLFKRNAARKPYAKALLQSEEHWNKRKGIWMEQAENVRLLNDSRGFVGASLENCSQETKRLLVPMMKHRIVEVFLRSVEQEAKSLDLAFEDHLETDEHRKTLEDFRKTADSAGAPGMEDLFRAWEFRVQRKILEDKEAEEKNLRLNGGNLCTMKELQQALYLASASKEDGLLEWKAGRTQDAIEFWRKGHDALLRVRAPATHEDEREAHRQLHVALLKNLAQAAIKMKNWNEALEAANLAIKLDDQDHKCWFRKVCALEGLGQLSEVEACLRRIDVLAIGRSDRDRIVAETKSKREQVRLQTEKHAASEKRMIEGGMKKSIFSEERRLETPKMDQPKPIVSKVPIPEVDETTRKRLTKEAAFDLMRELQGAYREHSFRMQVRKLAHDVPDQGEFTAYLNRVALVVQKPILEQFGFAPNDYGAAEMRKAVQDHTLSTSPDPKMLDMAEETLKALYGVYYEVTRRGTDGAVERVDEDAAFARALVKEAPAKSGDNDDSGKEDWQSWLPPCLYWTGRPRLQKARRKARTARLRRGGTGAAGCKTCSAAERKEIWSQLSAALAGADRDKLLQLTIRASEAGFSAVTLRSAKKRLEDLGEDMSDL